MTELDTSGVPTEGIVVNDDAVPVQPVRPLTLQQIDAYFARLDEIDAIISRVESVRAVANRRADERAASSIDPLSKERDELRAVIATFATRRRKSLLARHGKTVKLEHGTIKWRVIPRSLIAPKNTESIVAILLKMSGGKRYLKVSYTLDRRALLTANSRLLHRLGLKVSRHENLIIQATHEAEGTVVAHYPYPRVQTKKVD